MQKPLSVIINETKSNIIGAVNNSNLSPVILEPIVRDIYNEISNLARTQTENETRQYYAELAEVKRKNEETAEDENKE